MATNDQFDYLFKIVIIGDSGVGKTNLMLRHTQNTFNMESKATIGVQFATKTCIINGSTIKNQIWDTAGQQKYRAITSAYYRGAHGVIIVYDLTKSNTFDSIERWISELREFAEPDVVLMLVGNKCDLSNRQVKQEAAQEYASKKKLIYLETSALSGQNVQAAFSTLIKQIYEKNKALSPPSHLTISRTNHQGTDGNREQSNKSELLKQPHTQSESKVKLTQKNKKKGDRKKKQCC